MSIPRVSDNRGPLTPPRIVRASACSAITMDAALDMGHSWRLHWHWVTLGVDLSLSAPPRLGPPLPSGCMRARHGAGAYHSRPRPGLPGSRRRAHPAGPVPGDNQTSKGRRPHGAVSPRHELAGSRRPGPAPIASGRRIEGSRLSEAALGAGGDGGSGFDTRPAPSRETNRQEPVGYFPG